MTLCLHAGPLPPSPTLTLAGNGGIGGVGRPRSSPGQPPWRTGAGTGRVFCVQTGVSARNCDHLQGSVTERRLHLGHPAVCISRKSQVMLRTRPLSGTSLTCGRADSEGRSCVAGGPVRAGWGGLPEERGARRLLSPEACGARGWPSGVLATGVITTAHTTVGDLPRVSGLARVPPSWRGDARCGDEAEAREAGTRQV